MAQVAYSVSYSEYILSTSNYAIGPYDLNDNGDVVWTENDGNDQEIYVYYNGIITLKTMNGLNEKGPGINNSGQIIYEVYDSRYGWIIYRDDLYDSLDPFIIATANQTSQDNLSPKLNDNGHIAWRMFDGNDYEIYRHNGIATSKISTSSNDEGDAQINNGGDITWVERQGSLDYEILRYTGSGPQWITSYSYLNFAPQISDSGHVAWYGTAAGTGIKGEIFFSTGPGHILNISNTLTESDYNPRINSNDYVAWYGKVGSDTEIYLYNGGGTINISNSSFADKAPELNDSNHVVWQGHDGNDWEIFLYDGTMHQITNNDADDESPIINNAGDLLWKRTNGSVEELVLASLDSVTNHPCDMNDPFWVIDDFELLDAIDIWAQGGSCGDLLIDDFELLDLIDFWSAGSYCWDTSAGSYEAGTPDETGACQ